MAAWLILRVVQRRGADGAEQLTLDPLPAATVDRIVLVRALDSLDITRAGPAWVVNGNPASATTIESFLAAASDTSFRSDLVAQSAASFQRMGVDSAAGHRITVTAGGKTLLDLWQGNRGPELDGFYFRRVGDNHVFLIRGQFAEMSGQPADEWRDRQLAQIPAAEIGGIEITRGTTSYRLGRTRGGWSLSGGAAADTLKVARYLALFADLRASGFPDASDFATPMFAPAEGAVTISDTAGRSLLELRLDSAAVGYWAQSKSSPAVYRLESRVTQLLTPAESTFARP